MADTIDRVFGHALNTVNKIRPGPQKPPTETRLALYGLYKQAMEGNVAAIADRPLPHGHSNSATNEAIRRDQEKYDVWKSMEGLSRTEAKRRYIEKLIDTMHQYTNGTDQARELVEELEFVWDQVKGNSQHSSSTQSSPRRAVSNKGYLEGRPPTYEVIGMDHSVVGMNSSRSRQAKDQTTGLRVLSPVSREDKDRLDHADEDPDVEEFVDAPISQIDTGETTADFEEHVGTSPQHTPADQRLRSDHARNARWRARIESSIIRLTAEVAALREQLESHRFLSSRGSRSFTHWFFRLGWWALQISMANVVVIWIVILYMRRRRDPRLEGAIRVLLGDAVAQVQRVGREVKMPALPRIAVQRKS